MTSYRNPRWCALIRPPAGAPRPPPESTRRVVDRVDFDPAFDPGQPIECECCGSTMFYTAACKIQCPNCGYKRDCSDP